MAEARTGHKLLALDALRGLAACAVVLYHRAYRFPFPEGYLAVDFFFMLSGFVLAYSYQAKLDDGWSTKDFLATRLARLYPLYLLGLVLGFAVSLSDPAMQIGVHGWASALLNVFVLPAWVVPRLGPLHAFPYNIPAWSLMFESVVNVVHAVFLRRRSTGFLIAVVVASGAGLIAWTGRGPLNFGANTFEFAGGLLRVLFAYVMGMVLCRVWRRELWRLHPWAPLSGVVLLILLAGVGASRLGNSFDLIVVIGIFPVLLLLGAGAKIEGLVARVARQLGAASYAVYILHQPILHFLLLHGWSSPKGGGAASHAAASVCFVGGMFVVAGLVDRFYDSPVRRFLTQQKMAVSRSVGVSTEKRDYKAS